jgi:hypothetical protein
MDRVDSRRQQLAQLMGCTPSGLRDGLANGERYLFRWRGHPPELLSDGPPTALAMLLLKVIVKRLRLHLGHIEDELREVQRDFPEINAVLNCPRDDFTDAVRQNMLTAYEFLDAVVHDGLDLFSNEGLEALLELNHLVLLGRGYDPRAFGRHIAVTRRQFFDTFGRYVKPIRRWYRKHETENPYKVASQVYVGVLSQPQLYQEGNHRTGSLIASGILLQNGCPPFVLTRQNAIAYFNPSSEIKFTDKRTIHGKLRLPRYQHEFREFLQQNVNPAYVRWS